MNQMVKIIQNCLLSFTNKANIEGKIGHHYNSYWKESIKYFLSNKGKEQGFEVHSRQENGDDWVPDICWFELQDGVIKSLPLIVMCEWRPSPHIEQRFYSLIGARVHLRVAILDATFPNAPAGHAKSWAQQKVSELKHLVSAFDGSQPDDSYLFCVWCRDEGGGEWHFDLPQSE